MSGIVGVCPECGFSLRAHRTRVESVLDHAPWCPSIARKGPQIPACPHCATLRAELAQARAERNALWNNDSLCHECGHTDTEHADDVGAECRVAGCFCGGFISYASVARLSGREKAGIEADLAACRATLRELVEGALAREKSLLANFNAETSPNLNARWNKAITEARAMLARAEEEGKRDA